MATHHPERAPLPPRPQITTFQLLKQTLPEVCRTIFAEQREGLGVHSMPELLGSNVPSSPDTALDAASR